MSLYKPVFLQEIYANKKIWESFDFVLKVGKIPLTFPEEFPNSTSIWHL